MLKPTPAREAAVLYVFWIKTGWPALKYLMAAPFSMAQHLWCGIVHQGAGQWTPGGWGEGWCKLCGKDDDETGLVAYFATLMEIMVAVIVLGTIYRLRHPV